MELRKAVLQKIADDRYIVRLGIQRIGVVIAVAPNIGI